MYNLIHGDCLEVLRGLPEGSIDAVVTDCPYGLRFMGKSWDYQIPSVEVWAACYRVLKDGGRLLTFGGTRTYHRIACNIEDAGFTIEDSIQWLFGSGFPKHKSKLKPAYEPICVARKGYSSELQIDACRIPGAVPSVPQPMFNSPTGQVYGFKTGEGRNGEMSQATGRWPANILLSHSPGCVPCGVKRVKGTHRPGPAPFKANTVKISAIGQNGNHASTYTDPDGMETVEDWLCDASCPVAELDRQSGTLKSGGNGIRPRERTSSHALNEFNGIDYPHHHGDTGGASRFYKHCNWEPGEWEEAARYFYCAKASRSERGENNGHPTIKPQKLMRYLCRLICPPGGTVLDCFAGSGSTGIAALQEGFSFVGIEKEAEYFEIATRRIEDAAAKLKAAQPELITL